MQMSKRMHAQKDLGDMAASAHSYHNKSHGFLQQDGVMASPEAISNPRLPAPETVLNFGWPMPSLRHCFGCIICVLACHLLTQQQAFG